ncbi:hypothetical protein JT06_05725 [Desulfobulbus sp. Tol-SR]|nr:hypothetical protein JT06_05725 [Desulfobulbus sp. Tol-SR]
MLPPCLDKWFIAQNVRFNDILGDTTGTSSLSFQQGLDALPFFPWNKDKSRMTMMVNGLILSMFAHHVFLPLRY